MTTPNELPAELPIESLRRLARGLLFERSSADDLVQEAWLAALEQRGEIRALGGWLAGTVRRLAKNRARELVRRDRRERAAARAEAQPSALEASARIEILQRLLAAVDRLEPQYRAAIVLRYFDDLPPRAIAARLGIPVNTARTHVRRGLERLRGELDPGPGREREALLAALFPLSGSAEPGRAGREHLPPTWTSVMQHPLLLATSVLALGTLAWFLARPGSPVSSAGVARLAPASEPSAALSHAPAGNAAAQPEVHGQQDTAGGRSEAASAWTVRGTVFRDGAVPSPNVPLIGRLFAGGRATGTPLSEERFQADEQGAFAWAPATPEAGLYAIEVRAEVPGSIRDANSTWFMSSDPPLEDWWVWFTPLDVTLRGTVRGPDGAPLADAWVSTTPGDVAGGVRTAGDGSFALGAASSLQQKWVYAWKADLAPGLARITWPVPDPEPLYEITLQSELRVRGEVHDEDGTPLAGAEVRVSDQSLPISAPIVRTSGAFETRQGSSTGVGGSGQSTTTDASGRFEIGGIHPAATLVELRATAPGHRPREVRRFEHEGIAQRDWSFPLLRCLTVTGHVRAAGRPSEGAWVCVGEWPFAKATSESWCDGEGRFTLTDVAPGRQRLWIWRRGFAQLRHEVEVREGMVELELELRPGHFVGGIVLGPDGTAQPWAWVSADDASGAEPPAFAGNSTRTGADGRFRLEDLPACRIALTVNATGFETLTQEVALDGDDLVLRLAADVLELTSTPIVPVTAAQGNASLHGRLLELGSNAIAAQEIELFVAPAPDPPAAFARKNASEAFQPVAVVSAGSAPVAGPWRTTTDARGEFRITGLPAGTFDARWVRKEAGLTALDLETRVTLAADEARELELRPRGRATLRGTLEFLTEPPANTAVAGYGTTLGPPPGGMPKVAAFGLRRLAKDGSTLERRGGFAHDGRFELEGVTAGEWRFDPVLRLPGDRKSVV